MNGSQWITDNYKTIERWCKHWHKEEFRELIVHFAMYVDKNWIKFNAIPDDEQRIKFMQAWLKNMVKWPMSEFNKSIRVNNLPEEYNIPEEPEDSYIEIFAESSRSDIRDWMIDINRRHNELDVTRLMILRKVYLELGTPEKVLYDLYFTQMMSMRDIAIKIDLPLSAVYQMIKILKYKMKIKCGQ
jgi:DNA-directed RNA polymerase specialized sigma subunit